MQALLPKLVRTRPNRLCLALLLALPAHAASLGELQLGSQLGQLLDARVRVQALSEEHVGLDCIDAALREGGETGPAHRTLLDFVPDRQGGGWIVITSTGALNEPLVWLSLRLRCSTGPQIKRDYTLLLDPPSRETSTPSLPQPTPSSIQPTSPPAILPLAGQARFAAATAATPANSLYGMARQRYPRQPDARRYFIAAARALNPDLPANGEAALPPDFDFKPPPPLQPQANPLAEAQGAWTVQPGESFFNIVRRLYPDQPAEKKALVAAMRKLNPQLPRDGEKPLPAGMQLKLPEALAALPATAQQTVPAPSATPAATASPINNDRFVISGAPTRPVPGQTPEQTAMLARENELLEQSAEQVARLREAQDRIDKLDKRLAWLVDELDERDRAHAAALAEQRKGEWRQLAGAGLLGVSISGLLALGLMWMSRRKPNSSGEAERLAAAINGTEPPSRNAGRPMSAGVRNQAAGERNFDFGDGLDDETARPGMQTARGASEYEHSPGNHTSLDVDVFVLNSTASEAAVLAAHGQLDQAISLLEEAITAHPTSLVNWMQLLEILHGHRLADKFVVLARQFRQRFASEALWSKVRIMGAELMPEEALFSANSEAATDMLHQVLDADAPPGTLPPPKPDPRPQPLPDLVFELDQPEADTRPPEPLHLINVPPLGGSPDADPDSPLEQARLLIGAGEREAGAALLEHVLTHGTQDEKLAAAELLVKLTSPS
ncbi:hypothetical protein QWZ03_19620 [Chitinimonas viridis]|uniref:FimV N-terminal domain-containing protein n=1 Tax=Chitinimonas viridis TaxID=664880 RepID=A0ABT8BBP5_9NEIS|nr:hypothetical protein [Chitinimonas viridis]MDN3578981.1 hypothetical protein [Chitinimonas viridis]